MREFLSNFLVAVAALASVATLISFFEKINSQSNSTCLTIVTISVIVLISALYALFQIRRKKQVSLQLSPKFNLTIQESDLFSQKGIIVINSNEYFDTHVGHGVIDENTVYGMFINKYFKNRIEELNDKIKDALDEEHIEPIDKECIRHNKYGKTLKYPLGTCLKIYDGGNIYVIVAFTHFDDNDTAFISYTEYSEILNQLMLYLASMSESNAVHMPLMGTGLSRLNHSDMRILLFLIDNLEFQDLKPIQGGVNINITSLKKAGINLNQIETIFKSYIKK